MSDDDILLYNEEEFKNHPGVKAVVDEPVYPNFNDKQFLTNNENLFNNEDLPISFSPTRSVNLAGRWEMVRLSKLYRDYFDMLYNNNWVFERFPKTAALFFHQNTKKKFNKEFFFNESLDGLEDWPWAWDQIQAGFAVGQLTNIIYKEISKRSVLFTGNTVKKAQEIRVKSFVSTKILALESFNDAPSKNRSHSKTSCLSVYNLYATLYLQFYFSYDVFSN